MLFASCNRGEISDPTLIAETRCSAHSTV